MARFLPEYRELDTRSSWEKISMTISLFALFLLIPATALGYFSENSLPGQTLYPMKRGIESMILAIESVTPYGKSLYYQKLAGKRVDETSLLIAQAATTGNFSDSFQADESLTDVVFSVQQAATTITSISNPVEQQKAKVQLATSIQKYQTQLTEIHYSLQKNIIDISPTTQPTTSLSNQPTTPTPTNMSSTPIVPDPVIALQNQLTQTQNSLQSIATQLQQPPNVAPTLPTPTNTVFPTASPTPTPKHNKDTQQD